MITRRLTLACASILWLYQCIHAQSRLRLARLDAPTKHRIFRMNYYSFHTLDTTYFQKVVGYNDTTLFLQREVHDGDTMVHYRGNWPAPDWTMKEPIYRQVRMDLPIDRVTWIGMTARTGRTEIMVPFVLIGFCGVIGAAVTLPFAVFVNNGENMGAWAIGTSASVGLLITSAWAHRRIRKREAEKRWRLVRVPQL